MNSYDWYAQLLKPSWAPPSWLFGPVWTILYIVIAVTYTRVVQLYLAGTIPFAVLLPFILNIVANIAFTPLQFGLKNNLLASADIIVILITLIWALYAIYPYQQWISYSNIPYLLWVSFAAVLQLTITYLNF